MLFLRLRKMKFKELFLVFGLILVMFNSAFTQTYTEKECIDFIEKNVDSKHKVQYIHALLDIIFVNATDEARKSKKQAIIGYANSALEISDKLNYTRGSILSYNYLANIYNFFNVPNLYLKYRLKFSQNRKQLEEIQAKEIAIIKVAQAEKEAEIAALEFDKEKNATLIAQKKAELEKASSVLTQTLQKVKISEDLINLSSEQLKQKDDLLNESQSSLEMQARANDSLKAKNEAIIQVQQITELTLKAEKSKNWIYSLMGVIAAMVSIFLAVLLLGMNRTRVKLAEKNRIIAKEKERSEELLLNILPEEMAAELKKNGFAKAQSFENVTVFFSDFKDFTKISEQLSPTELVNEIDTCFKAFDMIIEKFDIEKIKTVGDAYICVSGISKKSPHNPAQVLLAAIEIRNYIDNRIAALKKEKKLFFEIRIGINTGPIVAGVVGLKKFAYDIWGDTVNTAARMEQNSLPGKINVSATTFEIVKDKFSFTYRGKIEAKNKGEIDMYFLESII